MSLCVIPITLQAGAGLLLNHCLEYVDGEWQMLTFCATKYINPNLMQPALAYIGYIAAA